MKSEIAVYLPLHTLSTPGEGDVEEEISEIFFSGGFCGASSRGSFRLVAPMNPQTSPIGQMSRAFEAKCAWRVPPKRGRKSNQERVLRLAGKLRGGTTPQERTETLGQLLTEARTSSLAAEAVLAAMTSEWRSQARKLVRAGMDPTDAESTVLSAAFETIRAWKCSGSRALERRVASKAWDKVKEGIGREERCRLRHVPLDTVGDVVEMQGPNPPGESLAWILASALAVGEISTREAMVIRATRIEGYSACEVAAELKTNRDCVRQIRLRAERRLLTFSARTCPKLPCVSSEGHSAQ